MPADRAGHGPTWLLVTGGGTGGHVIPGLAIVQAVVSAGRTLDEVHWLGSEIGIEADMVPAAGIGLTLLPGRGLNGRKLNLANLKAAAGVARAAWRGIGEVRRRRPAVVLALGGYAAVGGIVGAVVTRTPLVVTEQNAVASLANRLAGRFARVSAVPFEGADLPRAVVTGNPVRAEVVEAAAIAADPDLRVALRRELRVPDDATVVFAMSGSLGSRSVNQALIRALEELTGRDDLVVRHVIGRRDWNTDHAPRPRFEPGTGVDYRPVEFEDQSDRWLAAADLFIGRAGGSTVAELTVVGVASILVPLPIATRDHQRHNALPLVEAGSAVLISDDECTGERLRSEMVGLIDQPAKLRTMADRARTMGRPHAAREVAALLVEHARRD